MRNLRSWMVCGLAVAGAVAFQGASAQARPQYLGAFKTQYAALAAEADKAKCGICHPVMDKKTRNDYGKALTGALGTPNVKDADALKAALTKAEAGKGADGKTFGEIIKSGKLPN